MCMQVTNKDYEVMEKLYSHYDDLNEYNFDDHDKQGAQIIAAHREQAVKEALAEQKKLLTRNLNFLQERIVDMPNLIEISLQEQLNIQKIMGEEQWQDISTAPTDGTIFLAYSSYYKLPIPAKFVKDCERIRGIYFYGDEEEIEFWLDITPTHWRPLPTPPKVKDE